MIAAVISLTGHDFIDVADLDRKQLRQILDRAHAIKAGRWSERPLGGRHIAMLFQKPSHRTRVSFEVGIARLGGSTTTLTENDVQLGVRESVSDAARVLDRYVDGVVARLRSHEDLVRLADASEKPVINGLTDRSHPCQVLADLMTIEEVRGDHYQDEVDVDPRDCRCDVVDADVEVGLEEEVGSEPSEAVRPEREERDVPEVEQTGEADHHVEPEREHDVREREDLGVDESARLREEEREQQARRKAFMRYQVNQAVMDMAPNAVFMHCLPAHRGEEVTDEVIDGPRSVVFQQAGNRLYAQMALMSEIFGEGVARAQGAGQ